MADYDLDKAGKNLDRDDFHLRRPGMWRWCELLPVRNPENMLDLGEGDTPLLRAGRLGENLGLKNLYIKDESQNPTGSFKARGLAAAVSKAKELGIHRVIIPTAGNAGGAMAAYAARGGLEACIYMPTDTPRANIEESIITGAEVNLVDGLISDAAALAAERSQNEGWFDVSTFKEPYRTEGKKIMGYELAESFGWELPEVIIYPTGGGTGLVGMVKAFQEMQTMGWLKSGRMPRMVAVQSNGCAPVVAAFKAGKDRCEFWKDAETIASGLRVPKSFADRQILADIRHTQGTAVAVTDNSISEAQKLMARAEGIFAAPEGAATLAALIVLKQAGWIETEERVVLFNTGTGLKYI
jgi:threonine synthase